MDKDFDAWNDIKKLLQRRTDTAEEYFFKEGEVWWSALGINVGFEEDGKGPLFQRPVLIIRKFNEYVFLALPMTTTIKINNPYYFAIEGPDKVMRSVIISQIRLIDIRRLTERMFEIEGGVLNNIKKSVRRLFI